MSSRIHQLHSEREESEIKVVNSRVASESKDVRNTQAEKKDKEKKIKNKKKR